MHDYRRLQVWTRSRRLATEVYDVCRGWPGTERYAMAEQARRAAVSVPSNIAEGAGRGSPGDFARFLRIAIGSICELETLVLMAQDLGYDEPSATNGLLGEYIEVRKMLSSLAKKLGDLPAGHRSPQ